MTPTVLIKAHQTAEEEDADIEDLSQIEA